MKQTETRIPKNVNTVANSAIKNRTLLIRCPECKLYSTDFPEGMTWETSLLEPLV